jgi:hypothetical protein
VSPGSGHVLARRAALAVLGVSAVLAPLVLAAWFGLCPQYGNPRCPQAGGAADVYVAFRAAEGWPIQLFLVLNLLAPYLYPLSFIGLGWLAFRRSPWLALAGVSCGWLGSIPWGLIADQGFLLAHMAQLEHDVLFSELERSYASSWQVLVVFATWVGGHLLAYVLLAIALAKARVTPLWAASLLVVGAVLMGPVAYPAGAGWLQVAGFALVAIGSAPPALALVQPTSTPPAAPAAR